MLVSRLTLVLGVGVYVKQWSDPAWYFARAIELVQTGQYAENGVPTAFWPVGYPAFLAGVMQLTSAVPLAGQLANVVLAVVALLLLHRWCLQRFSDERVAGTAALLFALYPNAMGYSVGLYSEPLYIVLLLSVFVLIRPHASVGRMVCAGIILGLATLVKTQTLLLGPFLLLALTMPEVSAAGLRSALGRSLVGIAVMASTIAPWTYRNLVVMGAPIAVSTNGGMSLLAGNNPSMTTGLGYDFNDKDPIVKAVRFSVADQVAADARARAAAWHWIRENPAQFVGLMPKKLFRLWGPDGESEWLFQAGYSQYEDHRLAFRAVRVLNQAYYVLLLLGFALAWRRWLAPNDPTVWAVPLMFVFFSALSMVFSGQSRYHAPLMPFVIAFASWAFCHWAQNGRKS